MMKLSANYGKKDKVHILIDGDYQTTVDALYWETCGYKDGDELSDTEVSDFLRQANTRRAFNKAAGLLSYQDRTRKQLLDRLCEDYGEDAAVAAVDRLEELRLVDDERYAESFAAELLRRKKMAPARIRQELGRRGIDRETAEFAVEALDFDAQTCIIELLQTKYRGRFSDEKGLRRTIAALQRLGYGYGDIRSALRTLDEESDEF